MQKVKCLKCHWKGTSLQALKQWFSKDPDTSELLLICPVCKTGVCVGAK